MPKGWGYPIGAKKLSELLSESTRPLDLFFYYREVPQLTQYKEGSLQKLEGLNAYPSIYKFHKIMTVMWVEEKWGLSVFAINSAKKKGIKTIIETLLVPNILNWLNSERISTWFEGKHRFEIGVAADLSELCCWEIHNSWVVGAYFEDIRID